MQGMLEVGMLEAGMLGGNARAGNAGAANARAGNARVGNARNVYMLGNANTECYIRIGQNPPVCYST